MNGETRENMYQPPENERRRIQNFLLVWLDSNFDETKKDFKKAMNVLRKVVVSVETYRDTDKCLEFITNTKKQKIFLIVSGVLGEKFVPQVQSFSQMDSIYVYCGNESYHEKWAKNYIKVKGVYTMIEPICKSLQVDCVHCDRALIPISYDGTDALFVYTQLFKEALLAIDDDDRESIKDLVQYCREHEYDEEQIERIEKEYQDHPPIWWYTAEFFIYPTLNKGLREMEGDIILKFGFFIRHLHNNILKLYEEQQKGTNDIKKPFTLYRGQGLSRESFENMQKTKGKLMSFNNFLSTSKNPRISLEQYAIPRVLCSKDEVGILFVLQIDPQLCRNANIPFADVSEVGYYKGREAEILFTTHTVFRIDRIKPLPHEVCPDRLWEVELTLTTNDHDSETTKLIDSLQKDLQRLKGWHRIGEILIRVADPTNAESLYKLLLEKPCSETYKAAYYNQLGRIYDKLGKYSEAIEYYDKDLAIIQNTLPQDDPELGLRYHNIGSAYHSMNECSKALESYRKSLEIRHKTLSDNHPDLAMTYNNIGNVYDSMEESLEALNSYLKANEIQKKSLPSNHPDIATSYNNIGAAYADMGDYSAAVKSFELALEIRKMALPPYHPDLGTSYKNLGFAYKSLGKYSNALSHFEKAYTILKKTTNTDTDCDLDTIKKEIEIIKNMA